MGSLYMILKYTLQCTNMAYILKYTVHKYRFPFDIPLKKVLHCPDNKIN